jgi:hypothetical protein
MSEPPNASNRKSIRAQEKAAALRDRERREIISQIMVSRAGRSWLWDRLSETSIFSSTHVAGDALASAFQEGRRSVGLSLLADLMAYCPDQFILAMREQNERHQQSDPNPAAASADAERRGSPLPDGGDLGAEPDQAEPADDPDSGARYASPGRDIYTDAPTG